MSTPISLDLNSHQVVAAIVDGEPCLVVRAVNKSDDEKIAEALLLAGAKIEQLRSRIEVADLKAAALDRISRCVGALCITDAAKSLKISPRRLSKFLVEKRWMYYRVGPSYSAFQDKIDDGLLEHRIMTIPRSDGTERMMTQVVITPKGLARLSVMLCANAGQISSDQLVS